MSSGEEAHRSMGSMNSESLQAQGEIKESVELYQTPAPTKVKLAESVNLSQAPPPAPMKRGREIRNAKSALARKLWDDGKEAHEGGMEERAGCEGVLTRSPSATSD